MFTVKLFGSRQKQSKRFRKRHLAHQRRFLTIFVDFKNIKMQQILHIFHSNSIFLDSVQKYTGKCSKFVCCYDVTTYPRFVFRESVSTGNEVKLAERSKAPDLSSGTRKCAWVRTPHLTKITFFFDPKHFFPLLFIIITYPFPFFGQIKAK